MDHRLVQSISLFAGVSRRRRVELAALADEVTVPAGRALTREGAYATEFFVIIDGEAEVVTLRAAGATARDEPARLATLGPGDFFGEVELISGSPRSATVVALTPMRLLVSHRRDFATLKNRFPTVAARIQAAFAARTAIRAEASPYLERAAA